MAVERRTTAKQKLKKQLKLLLGGGMVDVELDNSHYDLAIEMAIDRAKQRTDGATEESYLFLTAEPDETVYTLPEQVLEIKKVYRRGVGGSTSTGINFDPFEAAFSNIYLLQKGTTGGLATWDFFSQYQETLGRVFGSELDFHWEPVLHKLTLIRKFRHKEELMIHVYNEKPDNIMIEDPYVGTWIRDYSLAQCKIMLGTARAKFSQLSGPDGAVTLDGEAMKQEGYTELERLEQEVLNFHTGRNGFPFIIG